MSIAQTILAQLGGNKFLVMTGAKNLVSTGDGLQFSIPKSNGINKVVITLDVNDTYRVEFHNINMKNVAKCRILAAKSDVYSNMLAQIFTNETGLETRL